MIKTGGTTFEGYMGGYGWSGINYNGYMSYAEINKIVKKEFKNKYPQAKVSCRGSSFSGGQECIGTLYIKESDIKTLEQFRQEINKYYDEKHYCFQVAHYLGWWDCDIYNTPYDQQVEILYNKMVNLYKGSHNLRNINEVDEMLLSKEVLEQHKYLNALYDSFNYCDNNSMVDYFDNNFYKFIYIEVKD